MIFRIAMFGGLVLLWLVGGVLLAQAPGEGQADNPAAAAGLPEGHAPAQGGPQSPQSVWKTLASPVALVIVFLSIAAVALVIEHVMTIRADVLMPPGLGETVHGLLATGQVAAADEACRREPSLLGYVMGAALTEVDGGWPAIEKAMEDAAAEQSARLFRKIEYLSVIGNIAPMLGLLGTVIGMIFAFQKVAGTQGAVRAADLAEGIYLALITTVEGLIVAIPSLAAFAVFRNRVDQLVAEAAYVAQRAFSPLKRNRAATGPAVPTPPPVQGER